LQLLLLVWELNSAAVCIDAWYMFTCRMSIAGFSQAVQLLLTSEEILLQMSGCIEAQR
jgi:hypothetical protein